MPFLSDYKYNRIRVQCTRCGNCDCIQAPNYYLPTFSMYCGKCGFVTTHKVLENF